MINCFQTFILYSLFSVLCALFSATAWGAVADIQNELADLIEKASKAYVKVGGASGAVVSADGYVLTNYHVVQGRLKQDWIIRVRGHGTFKGKVVGYDRGSADSGDIALLKLEGAKDLPYLEISSSDDLRVGQWVISLGNPYGVVVDNQPSASLGVVSAVHLAHNPNGLFYDDGIQTDASINPGNSGGPLIDLQGHLVGMTGRHSVRWKIRTSTGANYAVGASRVLRVLERMKIGDEIYPNRLEGLILGPDTDQGTVLVEEVGPGSQAESAGFRPGDQMIRFQGSRVTSAPSFTARIVPYAVGSKLVFDVMREGKEHRIETELRDRRDLMNDSAVLECVESVMRGHQHLPHPLTKQKLHLDFERSLQTVEKIEGNQASVILLYQDADKQLCEVDVVIQMNVQGRHRILRSTVGKIGETSFRP